MRYQMPKQILLTILVALTGTAVFAQNPFTAMINFPVNGHGLDELAENKLERTLKRLDLPYRCYRVEIIGHTDADGGTAFNAGLAKRRAQSVRNWLTDRGVPHFAIATDAEGEQRPIATNASEPGKARNRRVELRFTAGGGDCAKPFDFDVSAMQTENDAQRAANLTYLRSGTRIYIPGNSLVDHDGNAVTGPVTYTYKEWRNPVDFLMSGIPMDYPHAFSGQHFQSAGMFELRAFQDGKEVFLAPGRSASLKFAVADTATGYALYAYDESTRRWNPPNVDPFRWAPNTGNRGATPPGICEEASILAVSDTFATGFLAHLDSALMYLNQPRPWSGNTSNVRPTFASCWRNKQFAGVDYIGDLAASEHEDYLGLDLRGQPTSRRNKWYRLQLNDRLGRNPELNHVKHVGMYISAARFRRLPKDFTSRKFSDVRLTPSRGNSWTMTLKEPGRFYRLRVRIKDRRRMRTDRRRSALISYQEALRGRAEGYANSRQYALEREFWEYAKLLMDEGERCLRMGEWLAFFAQNPRRMKARYTEARLKYQGPEQLAVARNTLDTFLTDLKQRYDAGLSTPPRPPMFGKIYRDSTINAFMVDLTIGGFGVWNCDQAGRLVNAVTVQPRYQDRRGNPLRLHTISVIDERINGVLNYYGGYGTANLSLSPQSTWALIGIAQDNQRYYLNGAEVRALDLSGANPPIRFRKIPDSVRSASGLHELLATDRYKSVGMR